ncbi:hypothetical protein [Halorubrum lacusprofundi]|uniref:hypothetical protein n=1 Tax=Halorubrum lacusprofundi TaxID=2247 RepID=UPI001F5B63E4
MAGAVRFQCVVAGLQQALPVRLQPEPAVGDLVADGGLRLKANGKRLLEAGYHDVYPYRPSDERPGPAGAAGQTRAPPDRRTDAKAPPPPRRPGPAPARA